MVSVIIPNYNGLENLKKNLPQLLNLLTERKDELIIVDDKSTDGSIDHLKNIEEENSKKIKIKVIYKNINTGFSSTVNKGVSEASGDLILLLNTDVFITSDIIKILEKDLTENVFAVGALNVVVEDKNEIYEGRGVGKWKRGFLYHSAGDLNKNTTLWVSGGASLFDKKIWQKLGGLDEIYDPFYWEDIDLSYRALKSGYKLIFEKDAKVIHEHGKGSIRKKYSAFDIKKIAYRNQIIFVWKNASTKLLIQDLIWMPYHIIKSLMTLDFAFLSGFIFAVIRIPQIIKRRVALKKNVKLSDRSIMVEE